MAWFGPPIEDEKGYYFETPPENIPDSNFPITAIEDTPTIDLTVEDGVLKADLVPDTYVPYTGATADVDLGVHSLTSPEIIGGTGVNDDLHLRSTSGVGTTSSDVLLEVGTNGSLEGVRVSSITISVATGGTITTSGGYTIHTFTTNGNFVVTGALTADALIVAGGGGGGGATPPGGGAGGGAGGVIALTAYGLAPATYPIVVGGGGAGGAGGGAIGSNGSDSTFDGNTAVGGGGGGYNAFAANNGANGGSGGGAGVAGSLGAGGTGVGGQGNNGGANETANPDYGGGGGGGAGSVGTTGTTVGGNGGNGISSSISGAAVTYAGGGGGSTYNNTGTAGTGGTGGGGNGSINGVGGAGTANRGSGGGGSGNSNVGGAGGSGVVIISYLTPTTPNRIAVGVGGVTAPMALMHLNAGGTGSQTAPLKFTAGGVMSAVEIGAVEFIDNGVTGHLYITVNIAGVPTRVQIV